MPSPPSIPRLPHNLLSIYIGLCALIEEDHARSAPIISPFECTKEAAFRALSRPSAHDAAAETAGALQFASYHQQCCLHEHTLIAVGVLDLVPGCLSSVYFFHPSPPDYAFLSLDFTSYFVMPACVQA
ncbi:unnamed protein product [Hydatigera taeniaeformis]|uniref:ATE_C domain-containing protein n=1 Tax=Hydatigena taeniaeformis TaxID=6205 RepID=A0A0R3WTF1_HYDTA|nr:unnamed protein product [Hydatigera taeniaeformis]